MESFLMMGNYCKVKLPELIWIYFNEGINIWESEDMLIKGLSLIMNLLRFLVFIFGI